MRACFVVVVCFCCFVVVLFFVFCSLFCFLFVCLFVFSRDFQTSILNKRTKNQVNNDCIVFLVSFRVCFFKTPLLCFFTLVHFNLCTGQGSLTERWEVILKKVVSVSVFYTRCYAVRPRAGTAQY